VPVPLESEKKRRGLTDTLRESTTALQNRAERSGIVSDILRGKANLHGYALFLRNLLPAYAALEAGFARQKHPLLRAAAPPELARVQAIEADLDALCPDWRETLPVLPAGDAYQRRVAKAVTGNGRRLLSHAYVRYFGDINGGQALRRVLQRSLDLPLAALTFYRYPQIEALDIFKPKYRLAFDAAFDGGSDMDLLIAEAVTAFGLNIAVSEAVRTAAADCSGQPRAGQG